MMVKDRKKRKEEKEEKYRERIARAERRAQQIGVDTGIIQRFWELVSLFPRISDPGLERRVERFILLASPDQYFRMQCAIFAEATPYLMEDARMRKLMVDLDGKKIGLAVRDEYESTVTLDHNCFQVRQGITNGIPVITVMSRRDYADAILSRKDPVKMILSRKIRASHKVTLLRWVLPQIDLLKEEGLLEKYLSYQDELERVLEQNLTAMGY